MPHGWSLRDCGNCMNTTSIMIRQSMGCPYEAPRPDHVPSTMWTPPLEFAGFETTVCAGYTSKLPEVREIDHMRTHWKVGALTAACDGHQPHEHTLLALEVLEGSSNAVENYRMTPAKDGGGGA